jgi:hypothetical protein
MRAISLLNCNYFNNYRKSLGAQINGLNEELFEEIPMHKNTVVFFVRPSLAMFCSV